MLSLPLTRVGWITVFAWVVTVGGGALIVANTIQGLIAFHINTYEPKAWHTTLLMCGCLIFAAISNLFLRKVLNAVENISGVCHILFFIIAITILLTSAERSSPEFVFTTLTRDISGWSNPGVAWNIGLLTTVFGAGASDSVIHMST